MSDACDKCADELVTVKHATFGNDNFQKGKYIVLENIDIHFCVCGISYTVPCAAPLSRLVLADPAPFQHYLFNDRRKRWRRKR